MNNVYLSYELLEPYVHPDILSDECGYSFADLWYNDATCVGGKSPFAVLRDLKEFAESREAMGARKLARGVRLYMQEISRDLGL